jgi:general secretion pathway protein K
MAKKAQVLIIILWILVILTILAVSVGQRVSLALRLSRYQKERIRAHYLAKAGLNRAIIEIDNDINDFDALDETWSDNAETFQKISLDDSDNDFATVSYILKDDPVQVQFGAADEERKININTAPKELLLALLDEAGIVDAQKITDNIRAWRGDQDPLIPEDAKNYESLGYPCKNGAFSNIAEINLVKDLTFEDYQKIKGLITVYGDGRININTATLEVITILTRSIAKGLLIDESFADSFAQKKIMDYRDTNGPFKTANDVDNIPYTGDEEQNILNDLKSSITLKSDNFFIEVTGNVSKIKSRVGAVYHRSGEKAILYWHET